MIYSALTGIPEVDWLATPAVARELLLAQQQDIDHCRNQLTALATELSGLRVELFVLVPQRLHLADNLSDTGWRGGLVRF